MEPFAKIAKKILLVTYFRNALSWMFNRVLDTPLRMIGKCYYKYNSSITISTYVNVNFQKLESQSLFKYK